MARGKKRAAAVAVEKYVPSFGSSRQGQKKKKRLSCETEGINRRAASSQANTTTGSDSPPTPPSKADSSTQKEFETSHEPPSSKQPSTPTSPSDNQPSTSVSPSNNQPSTRVSTSNNHMSPSSNQSSTHMSPSNNQSSIHMSPSNNQSSTHMSPSSNQPSTRVSPNSSTQVTPRSFKTVSSNAQVDLMQVSSATQGESQTVAHNIQGELETSTTLPPINPEPTILTTLSPRSQPTSTIQQDIIPKCSPINESCPVVQQEHGCIDQEGCGKSLCAEVGEHVEEGEHTVAAAMPRAAAALLAPLPTMLPAGKTDWKSTGPGVDQLTRHEELQGIITELSLLNEFILKSKRELDNARAQYTRNRP